MAVSVRMDPLLEMQLEQAARRLGVTKSQFIIDAVERALGRSNPYELMVQLKAEESGARYQAQAKAFAGEQQPYDTEASRAAIVKSSRPSMTAALVDAGPMVCLFGIDQPRADHCLALFQQASQQQWSLSTTWPCVVEASYLLSPPQRCTLLRWIGARALSVFPFQQETLEDFVSP
jgi:predicted DNA-binding protein